LVFHKISKIAAGYRNTALITESGQLLLHGFNHIGQLVLKPDIRDHLLFFPEFMPIDSLLDYHVQDVIFGEAVMYALCTHKQTKEKAVFGWGSNEHGQLFESDEDQSLIPHDILPKIKNGIG